MKRVSLSVRTPRGRRFVVKLSSARHRLLRRAATLLGQTLNAFILDAMDEVLEDLRQLSVELRASVQDAHCSVQSGLDEIQAALSEKLARSPVQSSQTQPPNKPAPKAKAQAATPEAVAKRASKKR
jgi:hypothetical protein